MIVSQSRAFNWGISREFLDIRSNGSKLELQEINKHQIEDMQEYKGNIRKMDARLENGVAHYELPLYDILEPKERIDMNALIGREIKLSFNGDIHCRVTGKKIKKTYGEGLSYPAFVDSPLATPSIIRPELSRIHEGIALRDEEWERKHHLAPHVTYLSLTSHIKVGVTRSTNVPSRWIDQGATQAIILAEVPYRQAAGLIEVALKDHFSDKTNWRNMLKGIPTGETDLQVAKQSVAGALPAELAQYWAEDAEPLDIAFPLEHAPLKVTSMKLDKFPVIEKRLEGIKGQYLIFSDDTVMNIRSHSAYSITLTC